MAIQDRLMEDLKAAMRGGDKVRVEVIRSTRAALQNAQLELAKQQYDTAAREIELRYANDQEARDAALAAISADPHTPLDDAAQESVIAKEIKRRRDAAEIYQKAGRGELAANEEAEIAVLMAYLPEQLSLEELRSAVAAVIAELGLSGAGSIGKLMPVLMARFKGRAEGKLLSQVARELLSGS